MDNSIILLSGKEALKALYIKFDTVISLIVSHIYMTNDISTTIYIVCIT